MSKNGSFDQIKSSLTIFSSSSSLPRKESYKFFIITTFLCHGPCFFFYQNTSFASTLNPKPGGPCQWIMQVLKMCLLGTSNSMVTLTFFPSCKPNWSQDEFNVQSYILPGLGKTHGPWCKQPFSRSLTMYDSNIGICLRV